MLNDHEMVHLCRRLGLSPQAQSVIQTIRSSPPARRVQSAAGNVSVRYPSRKMGLTIQAESHRNELAGIYEMEHDPATLEYYDQPPPIKLIYPAKNGQSVGVLHTPDFFVLRTDAVGWEEWKTEAELERLTVEMPNRYARDAQGRWCCPPGDRYAAGFGFFYRVRSSAEIDWVVQRNLLFLEDYLRTECPAVAEAQAADILARVARHPGLRLDALLEQVGSAHTDDVYTLLATEQLYVNLRAAPLAEPDRVCVFRDTQTAQAYAVMTATASTAPIAGVRTVSMTPGSPVLWDGRRWTLVNCGEAATALLAEDGALVELPHPTFEALVRQGKLTGLAEPPPAGLRSEARDRLTRASPDDLREANRRYALLAPRLAGGSWAETTTPARTLRDWLARWREAERVLGCGYVGLLPRRSASGNHQRKLPATTLRLLDDFIANDYETLKQKRKVEVYGALVRACEAQGVLPPSYKTFAHAVNHRPRHSQVMKRQGPRAAYQQAPFYWELTLTTPRHGDRPFEIGHIDHTELDIELVCSRTGQPLGRPWATLLTDAFSRRVLAVSLTFDRPSYRACMLILRECVRRHSRLPQTVVVDGGAEFASVYFETLLARYECTKKTRPGAQPRFGSVCERLFGATNTRFVHNLLGNTQLLAHVRQVTTAVDPKGQACWTLDRLYARLCEWAYEVYDTLTHAALGQTPRAAFLAGLAQGGPRRHRLIPYDDDFRLVTLPTTRKGTAQVEPRLGVKIHAIYYWADALRDPAVEKTQVPVRFDPFDVGTAYAFVKGAWVRCLSQYYAQLAGRSERELMLATAELRRRHQQQVGRFTVTARQVADFLASVEAEEVLLSQRLRDGAARDVLRQMAEPTPAESGRGDNLSERRQGEGHADGQLAEPARLEPPSQDAKLVLYEDY